MTSENGSLWTKEQLAAWERDGFLVVPGLLDHEELAAIRKVTPPPPFLQATSRGHERWKIEQ
jgi:hypothetical protein